MMNRFSDVRGPTGLGNNPATLWGVAACDPELVWNARTRKHDLARPNRPKRSPAAIARRKAKRAAKGLGLTLKSYLRSLEAR